MQPTSVPGIYGVTLRPLLDRMKLTCTAWVEALDTRDDGRRKTYKYCHKQGSLYDVVLF